MSAAQWLVGVIGLVVSGATFVLMRFPEHRREQYRGDPFSLGASTVMALLVLAFCLACVWAQGQYEAGRSTGALDLRGIVAPHPSDRDA